MKAGPEELGQGASKTLALGLEGSEELSFRTLVSPKCTVRLGWVIRENFSAQLFFASVVVGCWSLSGKERDTLDIAALGELPT